MPPNPNCPLCHGEGERELVHLATTGEVIAIHYERCKCTFRATPTDDWTKERKPL